MPLGSINSVPSKYRPLKYASSDPTADVVPNATVSHSRNRPSKQKRNHQKTLPTQVMPDSVMRLLVPSSLIFLMMSAQVHAADVGSQVYQRSRSGRITLREGFRDGTPPIEKVIYPRQDSGDPFGPSTTSTKSVSSPVSSSASGAAATGQTALSSAAGTSVVVLVKSDVPTTTTSSFTTSSMLTAQISGTSSAIPKPFDTNIGSNFSSKACPDFFTSFLSNSTFNSCLPFSLLLQNSNSFFEASKYMNLITSTLDATCNVVFPTCSSLMSSLAQQLRLPTNCGQDYDLQDPLVTQAYAGLLAYDPLYKAGCKKDTDGSYCFANAITNTTSPADTYPYYLPLGVGLPGGSRPTCSSCLQNVMGYFQTDAAEKKSALNNDYMSAAQQINIRCGPSFLNTTIPQVSGSLTRPAGPYTMGVALLAAMATLLLAYIG